MKPEIILDGDAQHDLDSRTWNLCRYIIEAVHTFYDIAFKRDQPLYKLVGQDPALESIPATLLDQIHLRADAAAEALTF